VNEWLAIMENYGRMGLLLPDRQRKNGSKIARSRESGQSGDSSPDDPADGK
jgi:phage-related holin